MLPAVGQGALCIESRQDDSATDLVLRSIDHRETRIPVSGERAFLKRLEGSCHIPVACFGTLENNLVTLTGLVASEDGSRVIKECITSKTDTIEQAGIDLADRLLAKGGKAILENLEN